MLWTLLALLTFSCSDDDGQNQPEIADNSGKIKAVIVNQGPYTKGNASLSTIGDDGTVTNDVFRKANGRALGDIAQSMMYQNGKYFIVLNNSKKIEVVDAQNFTSLSTLLFKEEVKPRYMTAISDQEAVLSDMNRQLIRINTETCEVKETVPSEDGIRIEQMICVGDKLFGSAPGEGIYVYPTNDLRHPSPIPTECRPYETAALVLADHKIWSLGQNAEAKNVLYGIDPATTQVTDSLPIPDGMLTSFPRLAANPQTDKLYFDGRQDDKTYVFEADPATHTLTPYVELTDLGMLYGMNVSSDGTVFVADCLDHSGQRAYVREYRADNSVFSYKVGIYPGFIHFTENNR